MRNLLDLERQKEAIVVYEEVTQLLYDNFGVNPPTSCGPSTVRP